MHDNTTPIERGTRAVVEHGIWCMECDEPSMDCPHCVQLGHDVTVAVLRAVSGARGAVVGRMLTRGAEIRAAREAARMSQNALAEAMRRAGQEHWRQTTVSRVERDIQRLTVDEWFAIRDVFGVGGAS